MSDESFAISGKIGLERGYDRRQYAANALSWRQNLGLQHRQKKAESRILES
jgi:hypothetical protein